MDFDLQLRNVGKFYDNGTPAVVDFDLDVRKGEFIAFLGPSGCGKTTTLRMIAGFETITTGDILIRGRRINDMPPERRPTSMIFQNYALFPHMSVVTNLRFGMRRVAPGVVGFDEVIDLLGIEALLNRRPHTLSGGSGSASRSDGRCWPSRICC